MRLNRSYYRGTLYPLTGLYVGGVGVALLWANDHIRLETALILFTLVALAMLIVSIYTEIRSLHECVKRQRIEFLQGIEVLMLDNRVNPSTVKEMIR